MNTSIDDASEIVISPYGRIALITGELPSTSSKMRGCSSVSSPAKPGKFSSHANISRCPLLTLGTRISLVNSPPDLGTARHSNSRLPTTISKAPSGAGVSSSLKRIRPLTLTTCPAAIVSCSSPPVYRLRPVARSIAVKCPSDISKRKSLSKLHLSLPSPFLCSKHGTNSSKLQGQSEISTIGKKVISPSVSHDSGNNHVS